MKIIPTKILVPLDERQYSRCKRFYAPLEMITVCYGALAGFVISQLEDHQIVLDKLTNSYKIFADEYITNNSWYGAYSALGAMEAMIENEIQFS